MLFSCHKGTVGLRGTSSNTQLSHICWLPSEGWWWKALMCGTPSQEVQQWQRTSTEERNNWEGEDVDWRRDTGMDVTERYIRVWGEKIHAFEIYLSHQEKKRQKAPFMLCSKKFCVIRLHSDSAWPQKYSTEVDYDLICQTPYKGAERCTHWMHWIIIAICLSCTLFLSLHAQFQHIREIQAGARVKHTV